MELRRGVQGKVFVVKIFIIAIAELISGGVEAGARRVLTKRVKY